MRVNYDLIVILLRVNWKLIMSLIKNLLIVNYDLIGILLKVNVN